MMKRKGFAFWTYRRPEGQKNAPYREAIHSHWQNCPKFCDSPTPLFLHVINE